MNDASFANPLDGKYYRVNLFRVSTETGKQTSDYEPVSDGIRVLLSAFSPSVIILVGVMVGVTLQMIR